MFSKNIQINSKQTFSRRSVLKIGSTLPASMGLLSMGAMAQSLKGTVKLIVPFTAGSGPDIVSRILSPKLTTLWDTSVIVENKAGASGTIGADLVAKSPADGHTLMVGPASSITGPHLYAKLPFDIIKDLQPITNVGTTSLVLAVHKNFPTNTLQEFIAYVKARPGQINYGSPGNGTHHHLCMELLKIQTGLNLVHIPYKGSAGAENDLIAGIIPAMFLPIHVALAKMRAGQIKVLGSSLKERHPLFKEIPSLHEQGVTGYDVDLWLGVWGPAGMPAPLLNKLNSDIRTIVAQSETTEKLNAQGLIANTSSPEQFSKLVKEDWERWGRVIKEAKITAD
jgi:tripartite-type tricarboxylate transporter receptor subunit TctC